MIILDRYNTISELNVNQFNSRKIIFNATLGSCIEVENIILTLENIELFYKAKNLFFDRLNASKFDKYTILRKYNLFYKFILNFLTENKQVDKEINILFKNASLSSLAECSMLFVNEDESEKIDI